MNKGQGAVDGFVHLYAERWEQGSWQILLGINSVF